MVHPAQQLVMEKEDDEVSMTPAASVQLASGAVVTRQAQRRSIPGTEEGGDGQSLLGS